MAKIAVDQIRNIAFVGHGAIGKTSLLDALLCHAKAIERKGSVDDGSSFLDFDDEERHRKHTVESHVAHLDWRDIRFHVLDTPGYPDFMGQAISALHNVETAIIVIDAHRGIEVNTRRMFEEAGKAAVARVILINKLDTDNIHFEELIENIQTCFGKECVPFQVPVGLGQKFSGIVSCLTLPDTVPADVVMDPKELHDQLVERVVETDDEALTKFLDGEAPSLEAIDQLLIKAVAAQQIVPILCVCGKRDIGLGEFLDAMVEFAPSPATGLRRKAKLAEAEVALEPDSSKPLVARAFKLYHDKFGNLTYFRIYEGQMTANSAVKDSRTGGSHRLGQLNYVQGKNLEKTDSAGPGEFVCVAKVEGVEINDIVSTDGSYILPPVPFPKPMFPLAVNGKSRNDDGKILPALRKIMHDDPCFQLDRNEQTGETVMRGLSQLHLEVVQHRLKMRDHLEVEVHEPKIPYKETITKPNEASYRHKKQTGGRGQSAEVHLRVKPLERGAGFVFTNSVVGGVIPGQYIPAVEKGIRETMAKGILAGCEVVDLEAEVYFGKYHDVDSSEQAFKLASSMAFKEGFHKCAPILLEPVMTIEVVAPVEKMGDINGDLNTRRAQITGMDALPGNLQIVKAKVPLAELLRYQTELKSLTGGQGSYSMEYSHLAPVPPHVQQQVVDKHQKLRTEPVEV